MDPTDVAALGVCVVAAEVVVLAAAERAAPVVVVLLFVTLALVSRVVEGETDEDFMVVLAGATVLEGAGFAWLNTALFVGDVPPPGDVFPLACRCCCCFSQLPNFLPTPFSLEFKREEGTGVVAACLSLAAADDDGGVGAGGDGFGGAEVDFLLKAPELGAEEPNCWCLPGLLRGTVRRTTGISLPLSSSR